MTADSPSRSGDWLGRNLFRPLAISSGFVLVALLWTFPLQYVISYPFVFLFFGAVIGSAWFGGMIAGTSAVAFSSLLITYFFIPPLYSFAIDKGARTFVAAYILCAIVITLVSSARKRAENAVLRVRDELELKVSERTAQLEHSNREIRESERQLRTLTEAIPQQIWRASASGRIEYCNQHLRDYLGIASDAPRLDLFSVLHPDDIPVVRPILEAALSASQPFEIQARVRSDSSAYRWFLIRSLPQRSADGVVSCWYGTHIDIEEQHSAQQRLVRAQDDLSRLSRTLSLAEMAASIAHELNQPLTAVVTLSHACRKWLSSNPANLEKATATAEKIVRESTRASAVVQRVRALFGSGDEELRESTDINTLIRELARLLRDDAIRRGVTIRLALAPSLPRVSIDPVQIQQVLLNLATNGMDAMAASPHPREIVLSSALEAPDRVLIAVEDTGPGLAPDTAARIFEPFFSTKPHGIGMGLAICRSIVEAHDSRLVAANREHGGACFHFTLRSRAS